MTLSPAGETMRAQAESALRRRHAVLLDRSRRRALTQWERAEIGGLGWALNELLELEAPQQSSAGHFEPGPYAEQPPGVSS